MSTKTITFRFRVDNVLTNATSVVLSDPTGTFGVKRNDTNAVVVADGVAMTSSSTGIYSKSFTEPAPGLTYTAYVEWVYQGETYRVERTLTGASSTAIDSGTNLMRTSIWSIVSPPEEDVVDWDDVKAQLRIDDDDERQSGELFIAAAIDYAQERTESSLVEQTLRATFYDGETIELPRGPIIAIESVTDRDDVDITEYELTNAGLTTTLVPTSLGAGYPISVVYRAGFGDKTNVPAMMRLAILTHVGTLFENRESVSEKTMTPVPHSLNDFYRRKARGLGIG